MSKYDREPVARKRKVGAVIDQSHLADACKFALREIQSNRMLPKYLDDALTKFVKTYNARNQENLVKNLVNRLSREDGLAISKAPAQGSDQTAFTRAADMLEMSVSTIESLYYKTDPKIDI